MKPNLAIIGKGAFGSALSQIYSANGFAVGQFGREMPSDFGQDFVFLAVPSSSIAAVMSATTISASSTVILCCKGLLPDGDVPSTVMPPDLNWAVLSGPGFAQELSQGLPAIHTIAAASGSPAQMAEQLSLPTLRLYPSSDPVGVQVCGALKNILAIAAGMCDALALGENARAALITRGVAEFRHAVRSFSGQEDTLWSPAGLGDLILTCTSDKSRNYRFGQLIGQGVATQAALDQLGTVEGLHSVTALLSKSDPDKLPIVAALSAVLSKGLDPSDALAQLMARPIGKA